MVRGLAWGFWCVVALFRIPFTFYLVLQLKEICVRASSCSIWCGVESGRLQLRRFTAGFRVERVFCVHCKRRGVMVRTRPSGDAFGSNRRSPTLQRRRRDMEENNKAQAAPAAAAAASPSARWAQISRKLLKFYMHIWPETFAIYDITAFCTLPG